MPPKNFYNLPPSWNPGYEIPDYVMAEPPERGVFVTQWMPRGTIPQLIPEFYAKPGKKLLGRRDAGLGSLGGTVFSERTLSGSTLRGSSLAGDSLGAQEYQLEPEALDGASAIGHRAAKRMIASVKRLPAAHRGPAMKKAMAMIDPTLYKRATALANHARARGMHPAAALQHGIAAALAGRRTSSTSQSRSPRRLGGRRGLTALGASPKGGITGSGGALVVANQTSVPVEGACTMDSQYVFTGGSWRRRGATSPPCSMWFTGPISAVNVHDGGAGEGGVNVTDTPAGVGDGKGQIIVNNQLPSDDSSGAVGQLLQAGPFSIPLGAKQYTIHFQRGDSWPQDWIDFITQELAHDCSNCVITSMQDATAGHPMGVLRDFFGSNTPPQVNKDLVYLAGAVLIPGSDAPGSTPRWRIDIKLPDQPIVLVTRPDTGEVWGLFLVVAPRDPSYSWDSTTNPYELSVVWKKNPTGVWDWIKKIVGTIVDIVKDVACAALPAASKTPNAGAQAAAGALLLSGVCTQNCPPGMIWNPGLNSCQAAPLSNTFMPLLLIGGLGLLGVYFATR